jgi:hypothetical protein
MKRRDFITLLNGAAVALRSRVDGGDIADTRPRWGR